ncbi:MAG: fibronectin/fibrinogen-binding protein [Lachnospiraceae bacterium]|nr:fibronectin/fibrinogen-binding protein [Lachnospiraceae bacterium]
MALDGVTIACMVTELNKSIFDGRINKIAQPEKDELLLTIKSGRTQIRLDISANASLPLMYLTEVNKPGPLTAPNFCMLLRKHISGGRIVSITQPEMERIIDFEIEHLDEMGDLCRKHLIVELMGKHSNIIFTDHKHMIIDSIKHIGANTSSVREVLPGRDYFIPKTVEKSNPLTAGKDDFFATVYSKTGPVFRVIYSSYTGLSPLMAEEICYRAGIDGNTDIAELDDNGRLHLYNIFTHVMSDIKEENFSPSIICEDDGSFLEFACLNLRMYEDKEQRKYDSISNLLVDYWAGKAVSSRIKQKSYDLRKITGTLLDREKKKYSLQLKQLEDTKDRDKYRIYGELINTYGYSMPPGEKTLVATNYYNNEEVRIPMDPDLTVAENSVRYFDKYNKKKRTFDALSVLIEETKADINHLESISTALDQALDEASLKDIRRELSDCGYIKSKTVGKQKSAKSKPHHYLSSEGYDIYVGKNNYQNDELTFKMASGSDWWFHAKEMPGSHVILRAKSGEVTDKAMEEAAALAAYYSAGRGSGKVEIDYSLKKNIKKPAGAKPGFVVYYTNYSMSISPDISKLKELAE